MDHKSITTPNKHQRAPPRPECLSPRPPPALTGQASGLPPPSLSLYPPLSGRGGGGGSAGARSQPTQLGSAAPASSPSAAPGLKPRGASLPLTFSRERFSGQRGSASAMVPATGRARSRPARRRPQITRARLPAQQPARPRARAQTSGPPPRRLLGDVVRAAAALCSPGRAVAGPDLGGAGD